jgi:hypothetical protein
VSLCGLSCGVEQQDIVNALQVVKSNFIASPFEQAEPVRRKCCEYNPPWFPSLQPQARHLRGWKNPLPCR